MDSIGWFDAWSRWASGDPDLTEQFLWGVQVLWWGRIGKISAFVGGLTLVLDIIGPERLRQITLRSARNMEKGSRRLEMTILLGVFAVLLIFIALSFNSTYPGEVIPDGTQVNNVFAQISVAGIIGILIILILLHARRILIWLFENDKTAFVVRIVSLVLLVFGFHFDMLAS